MTISSPIKGTVLLTADYQRIYPIPVGDVLRTPHWVEGWIYFHELTSGDEVTVKVYDYDNEGQQHRVYDQPVILYSGSPPATSVANTPACHIGAILSEWVRIDIAQTAGGPNYKNVNYKFFEVT